MIQDLEKILATLKIAKHPEDFFGKDPSIINRSLYRRYVQILHPDKYGGNDYAYKIFIELYEKANIKIKSGKYGKIFDEFEIKGKNKYLITSMISDGDISKVYLSDTGYAVKISSYPEYNTHIKKEFELLSEIFPKNTDENSGILKLFTKPIECFSIKTRKNIYQINILEDASKNRVRLDKLLDYYPNGVDFKHVAWMFKRFLMIIGYMHNKGLIHGSVIPEHLYVHPTEHGAKLVDWCWVTKNSSPLEAISPTREEFYPPEVFKKLPLSPASDIYMAAKCAFFILDKTTAPPKFIGFLKSCTIGNPTQRPQNAWEVHDEIKDLMIKLIGNPKYIELRIP